MNDHHREQKTAIVSTAFIEWGKTHFTAMSLQAIASKLSITKPALYRYFRNKDELLDTMVATFAGDLQSGIAGFLDRSAPDSVEAAVRDYYGFLFDFFTARRYYLAFLLFYVLRRIKVLPPSLSALRGPLNAYFRPLLETRAPNRDSVSRAAASRFIQMHGIFWVMQLYRRERNAAAESRLLDFRKRIPRSEMVKVRDQAVVYCLEGYCQRAGLDEAAMAAISADCWISPADLPEPDRIFSAVEAVIGEAGLSGASVERIAERIGINKSSLYFYFKNRDTMLKETIRRERDHFIALLVERIETRASFAEKLFAFCVAILSYMKSNPPLMSVLHWMQYQNIGLTPFKDDLQPLIEKFDFLKRAQHSGELTYRGENPVLILVFIFFFLMNENRLVPSIGAGPRAAVRHLGRIFSILCRGLGTGNPEKRNITDTRSTQCRKQSVSARRS